MSLSNFTNKQLQEELNKRETKAKEANKPKPLISPDLSELQELCIDYINHVANGEHFKDIEYWIYETSLKSIYGKDIFKWLNNQANSE